MAASRSLTSLRPEVQRLALEWHKRCDDAGIDALVYCTYRGLAEQAALYARGRAPVEEVNRLNKLAGCDPVTAAVAGKIVTNAKPGFSWHNHSQAWDAVPMAAGRANWNAIETYKRMGAIAADLGIEWGGTWRGRKIDRPHFQVTLGYRIEDLARLLLG